MAAVILTYNKNLITKTLGKQGSQQCGVYSVAYGYTILEQKCRVTGSPASHEAVARKYNGGVFAMCQWGVMGVTSHTASSVSDRYSKILAELRKGKPVVVAVQGSSANHYVLVIGYKEGITASTAKGTDFYIIDPADCGIGYYGTTWAAKNGFNNSSYGLQYITFSGKGVGTTGAGHSKEWYIKKYGNSAKVYFELKGYGYSHKACCALMGNIEQESGFKVKTNGSFDGNQSEGLCQWTFGRKSKMQAYAKKHSATKNWASVDGQVAYLVYELKNSYSAVNNYLKQDSHSLHQMVDYFCDHFEVPDPKYANKAARYKFADKWDKLFSGVDDGSGNPYEEGEAVIDMRQRIENLYSAQLFSFDNEVATGAEPEATNQMAENIKGYLSNVKFIDNDSAAVPEQIALSNVTDSTKFRSSRKVESKLQLSDAFVEAPFVELVLGDYVIGSYKSSTDDYPNYIKGLNVRKINGEINQYEISLVYQIRYGEDPNKIDKLLSKVRYNKIGIRYGDCMSGGIFKDYEAVISNVVANRDYAGSRISYTIYAISACHYVTSYRTNFPAVIDKPSNVIRKVLWESGETSRLLQEAFPGMKDRLSVESRGLLPNNDAVLNISEKINVTPIEYINFLVSAMVGAVGRVASDMAAMIENVVSTVGDEIDDILSRLPFYITYEDDEEGAYFRIDEFDKKASKTTITNNVFEVYVGYPDDNYILNFSINNDSSWALLYNNGAVASEYVYDINNNGEGTYRYSPNRNSASNSLTETEKNWWNQMVTHPITAELTLRGLLKPVNLMDYIDVHVVFYGQEHITSGTYVITAQQDVLNGSGFVTKLSLTRVGEY